MRILLSVISISFFINSIFSQVVNIPDANFKQYLVSNTEVNTNGDSEIQVAEATAFTGSLHFQFWSINDLTGIEAFTNLKVLDCGDNNLTSLDLSQNIALEQLYCYDNSLSSLDLSANINLIALDCRDNQILNLDLSQNPNLNYLQCPFNGMISLNVSNTSMETLRCYSNALTDLNLTNTESTLSILRVYNNFIEELDLSNFSELTIFECHNSSALTSVNIANANNTSITTFRSTNTPNLDCIQVDDEIYSTTNWISVDEVNTFSEDCSSLSVNEFNNNLLTFYPNPVKKELNIKLLEVLKYNIFTLKGEVIKQGKLQSNINEIDVSMLTQGIYLFQGKSTTGKSISIRFVKQ